MYVFALTIATDYEGSRLHSIHADNPEAKAKAIELMTEMQYNCKLHSDQAAFLTRIKMGFDPEQDIGLVPAVFSVSGCNEMQAQIRRQEIRDSKMDPVTHDSKVSARRGFASHILNDNYYTSTSAERGIARKAYHKASRHAAKQDLREYTR